MSGVITTIRAWLQTYALAAGCIVIAVASGTAVVLWVQLEHERTAHAEDNAKWADAKVAAAQTYAASLAQSITEGNRRVQVLADVVNDQAQRAAAAEARAARESAAVGGLRNRAAVLASAAGTCTADTAVAAQRAADRLADAVNRLAEAGRRTAAIGDRAINRGRGAEAAYDALKTPTSEPVAQP